MVHPIARERASSGLRMQRDPVAFGIDNDCAKAVWANLMFFFEDASAFLARRSDRVLEPAFHAQINERPVFRRTIILRLHQTAGDIFVLVRQQSEFKSGRRFFADRCPEDRRIKFNRAIEICDWDVRPANGVLSTHLMASR